MDEEQCWEGLGIHFGGFGWLWPAILRVLASKVGFGASLGALGGAFEYLGDLLGARGSTFSVLAVLLRSILMNIWRPCRPLGMHFGSLGCHFEEFARQLVCRKTYIDF